MIRHLAFAFLLAASPAFAQAPAYPKAERVDALAQAEFAAQEAVGLAVVVIDGGEVAWSKGYGHADREADVPVDPAKTQFRWASISKPVTAIAALQLAEKKKLDLDADVRSYVPEFPDKGVKITPRELLCHQGGIVHYTNGPVVRTFQTYTDPHPFADVVRALDEFKESPLICQPGTKYSYTTHGFMLLAAVVQRAGGEGYADQVHKRIAEPLGMKDFRPDYQWEDIPNRAAGYHKHEGKIVRRDPEHDVSWKLGGGGFTSPAVDLARFGVGLIQHKLVDQETERAMWTPNKPSDPTGAKPYGYGFFIQELENGRKLVGHDGSQEKSRTALLFNPQTGKGVAVMSNSEWFNPMKLARKALDAIE